MNTLWVSAGLVLLVWTWGWPGLWAGLCLLLALSIARK